MWWLSPKRWEQSRSNLYFLVCTGRGQGNTDISNEAYEEALKLLYEQQMKYKGRLMINSKCAPQYKTGGV